MPRDRWSPWFMHNCGNNLKAIRFWKFCFILIARLNSTNLIPTVFYVTRCIRLYLRCKDATSLFEVIPIATPNQHRFGQAPVWLQSNAPSSDLPCLADRATCWAQRRFSAASAAMCPSSGPTGTLSLSVLDPDPPSRQSDMLRSGDSAVSTALCPQPGLSGVK